MAVLYRHSDIISVHPGEVQEFLGLGSSGNPFNEWAPDQMKEDLTQLLWSDMNFRILRIFHMHIGWYGSRRRNNPTYGVPVPIETFIPDADGSGFKFVDNPATEDGGKRARTDDFKWAVFAEKISMICADHPGKNNVLAESCEKIVKHKRYLLLCRSSVRQPADGMITPFSSGSIHE